jgi:hypothetical protein
MTRKMMGNIGTRHLIALGRLICHHHDFNHVAQPDERQGVGRGPRRAAAAVPAQHDAIECEAGSLNVGKRPERENFWSRPVRRSPEACA